MVKLIAIVVLVILYALWTWYELKHAKTIDDDSGVFDGNDDKLN